jgi:hypothetical protein
VSTTIQLLSSSGYRGLALGDVCTSLASAKGPRGHGPFVCYLAGAKGLTLVLALIKGLSLLQICVRLFMKLVLKDLQPFIVALTEQSVCTSLWLARPQAHILSN